MCDRCSFNIALYDYLVCYRQYELPDGGNVAVPIRPVWCFQCNTVSPAEDLPKLATARKKMEQARITHSNILKGVKLDEAEMVSAAKWLAEGRLEPAERLHYVVSHRKSPHRCLTCGSFDHKAFPLPSYPSGKRTTLKVKHPGCGGNFIIDDRASLYADIRGPDVYYSIEGIKIREDCPF